ncbi:hypothetical protein [Streptomyces sp. HNM0574]|uniref:hypothetical protein n=1 Tax=Streptomyces sp. HNM0574 TaxID=2714954 RepID=UPI00146B2826|nr:hypothetical protein [Streptomyces sp. HNM0574]NLU68204.1 hypothetical protein [Streptomyces sp. HNM0574]
MSDYFDRLLARHAPAARPAPGAPAARRVRVRPRLPGPFERVEALRGDRDEYQLETPARPDAPASRPDSGPARGTAPGVREIRTERETVVRAGPAPREDTAPRPRADQQGPRAAPLRPVPRTPRPFAAPAGDGRRRGGRPDGPAAPAPSAPAAPAASTGLFGEPVTALPAARPASGDRAAARDAQRAAPGGRRGGQGQAERVVHVQIGRLEVSAASPAAPSRGGGPGARRETGRTAPTVSLEDYLARGGRNGERSN